MDDRAALVFMALFGVSLLETLVSHLGKGEKSRAALTIKALIQVPLFVAAFYVAFREGLLDRRLVSLIEIIPGLIGGHLVFTLSVLANHASLQDAHLVLTGVGSLWGFLVTNPNLAFRTLHLCFTEELIYRAAFQTLLTLWWGPLPAILITALLFVISHEHVFTNRVRGTIEFAAFSLLLGTVYYATFSLAAVIAIHAVRNFEIAELEFSARAHELGSEEAAQQEFDKKYRQETASAS